MSDPDRTPATNIATREMTLDEEPEVKSKPGTGVKHKKQRLDAGNTANDQRALNNSSSSSSGANTGEFERSQSDKAPKAPRKNTKKDIKDLAGFIVYAYSRKGQRLSLTPKIEKAICNNPKLDSKSRERLLSLAKEDILLAVPRQILLAVRNIVGYPNLKNEVRCFIKDALKMHPIFSIPELEGSLENLDNALDPRRALGVLFETDYSKLPELSVKKPLKPRDYELLRANAIYSLAIWFSETRNLTLERLNQYLFECLWQPHTSEAKDEAARLRILTDIRDLAGVGIACAVFKRQLDQQMQVADSAKRAENSALERLQRLNTSYQELQRDLNDRDNRISELNKSLDAEKRAHEYTRIHLSDDLENLRSRLLRRLRNEVELLDEGLHALRRDPPKIRIMEDHAERAIEGLKKEIKELGENE